MAIDEGRQNGQEIQLEQMKENEVDSTFWKKRVKLNLAVGATELLAHRKRTSVMYDNQIYEIIPNNKEMVQFRGKKHLLDEKTAKRIARLLKQGKKIPAKVEVMQTA